MSYQLINTSHGRKLLFDRILSAELAVCKYKINAFYEWKNQAQIFSLRFIDADRVKLGINLNLAAEDVFSGSSRAMELTICYRAYYMAAYLRCLENAAETVPHTLFQGLVLLEAIADIHGKETIAAYSPLFDQSASRVKPIDVHSAIRSLSRIRIEQKERLSQGVQANCENAVDWMVNYTRLPEIEYNKPKRPEYTVLSDLLRVKKIVDTAPSLLAQYALFAHYGILRFDDRTIYDLLTNESLNEFWAEVLIRVWAFSNNKKYPLDVTVFPQLRKSICKFKEDSVACFQECSTSKQKVLKDNLLAVKKTAMQIEQAFYETGPVETGALHFMQ